MYNSPKKNIRSFRFSDEVATVLEAQEGKNLNDKFENLVLFCYHTVEKRRQELERTNAEIREQRDKLYNLSRQTEQLNMLHKDLETMKRYLEMAGRRAKNIADGTLM